MSTLVLPHLEVCFEVDFDFELERDGYGDGWAEMVVVNVVWGNLGER
jgi:hypothetical protein